MYKIMISVNNNEEVFTLPHVPVDFPLPEPEQNNETIYRTESGLSKNWDDGTASVLLEQFLSGWTQISFYAAGSSGGRMGLCKLFSEMERAKSAISL